MLYTIFLGDAVKTAHALDVPVTYIVTLAKEQEWDAKVGQLAELRKSDKPGDLERAINRAVNFAQAHRTRQQLERVLKMVEGWSEGELRENLLPPAPIDKKSGRIGHSFTTRPFADLTASLEKAHMLTYLALGDTAQDRARRKEETNDSVLAASALHRQIASAMSKLEISPKEKLLAEQMVQADIAANRAKTSEPKIAPREQPVVPPLEGQTDETSV